METGGTYSFQLPKKKRFDGHVVVGQSFLSLLVKVSRNALECRSEAPKFVPLAFQGP